VIIELSSYLFSGGAHGRPGRAFINYAPPAQGAELQDMLLPGRKSLLERRGWPTRLDVQHRLANRRRVRQDWPFQKTPHVALTFGALTLKYDIDRIAPHSVGHPELKIPYPRLNGIVKPYYFPGRGAQAGLS
jgi:hypothetical protein